MVTGVPLLQDGGLADWGVATHDTGEGITPGLIYEEERLVLGFRPLLRAGQRSSRQRVIAASSRWRARRAAPGGERWERAVGPPSRARVIH
jgi:hypothetical protein